MLFSPMLSGVIYVCIGLCTLCENNKKKMIKKDKKGDKAKIRTQQYIKLNTGEKGIQQVNPVALTADKTSGTSHLIYR